MIDVHDEARKLVKNILTDEEILEGLTIEYFKGGVNVTAKLCIFGYERFKQVEDEARKARREKWCVNCERSEQRGPCYLETKKEGQNDQTSR